MIALLVNSGSALDVELYPNTRPIEVALGEMLHKGRPASDKGCHETLHKNCLLSTSAAKRELKEVNCTFGKRGTTASKRWPAERLVL